MPKKKNIEYDTSNMGRPKEYDHDGERKVRSCRFTDDQMNLVLEYFPTFQEFIESSYMKLAARKARS